MQPAGKRRERVSFQQRGTDENGDPLGEWDVAGAVVRWARVTVRTKGDVALQQRLQGLQPAEVIVLADSATRSITAAWRAVWRDKVYAILGEPAPTEDRRELAILIQADGSHE